MEEFDKILDDAMTAHNFRFQQQLIDKLGITRQTIATWRRAGDTARLQKALQKMEANALKQDVEPFPGLKPRKLPSFLMIEQMSISPAIKNALLLQTSAIVRLVCEELRSQAIEKENGTLVWPEYQTSVDSGDNEDLKKIDEVFEVTKSVKKIIISLEDGFVQSSF
jgi:hypothetical protein